MSAGPSTSAHSSAFGTMENEDEGSENSQLIPDDGYLQSTTSTKSGGSRGGAGYGMSGRKYGRKRVISVAGTVGNGMSIMGLSATTLIGLLLLLTMVTLTILSVCLQRYSTNTYVDIIVPPHNSTNASNVDIVVPDQIL